MTPRLLVLAGLLLGLAYGFSGWIVRPDTGPFDFDSFGQLPVQVGGRIKPLDTVARTNLMLLREKQSAEPGSEAGPRTVPALVWLAEMSARPEVASTLGVFRIDHPELQAVLGLPEDAGTTFALEDLQPHFAEIDRQFRGIEPEPEKRDSYETAVAELYEHLTRYHSLQNSFYPPGSGDRLLEEYGNFASIVEPGLGALRAQETGGEYNEELLGLFMAFADRYLSLSRQTLLRIVPPAPGDANTEDWDNLGHGLLRTIQTGEVDPVILGYARLKTAYRDGDADTFNEVAGEMRQAFIERFPEDKAMVSFEYHFNQAEPFYHGIVLYMAGFLLILGSWLRWPVALNRIAFGLLVAALLVHTFGLVSRMVIQGRPPVTNLYSSAVFVGWGAVVLGLILERIFRNGIGGGAAALVGFTTLIIAHHLALTGDTLEMMQAVLDSNFWLATHVVVITLGYSAVFLAGAIGIFFLVRRAFGLPMAATEERSLYGMVYGITCFAILFSFVGTMLGGIWADQSWGRFWGWDPKENGALLIVIWTALMLHARWGGLVRARGFMMLAVAGNIITAWSWFGTNMLGVGLHSYGFMDEAFFWLMLFVLSQLAVIGLGYLPGGRLGRSRG